MKQTFLIADSGSTKTDWFLIQAGKHIDTVNTKGMNPFFQTSEEREEEIRQHLLPHVPVDEITAVFFYGAGCIPEKTPAVAGSLQDCFPHATTIEVNSDLLAAARSLCGHSAGIACILGTGSNSCFYDGEKISYNVPALGFILGDEGSGANLGKLLVGDILKNQLGAELKEKFFKQFDTNMADIIEHVYRQPFPNRYLASLNIFLEQNKELPEIKKLLVNAFKAFIKRNVLQYDYKRYPMNCIGTIAAIYKDEILQAAQELGIKVGTITKSPVEGLLQYHLKERD